MTHNDPGIQKTPRSQCDLRGSSARAARVGLVLAIIAITVGAGCILGGQLPPGIIFILAGVAGIMTWHRSSSPCR